MSANAANVSLLGIYIVCLFFILVNVLVLNVLLVFKINLCLAGVINSVSHSSHFESSSEVLNVLAS